ncbi:MAG: ribulokinase, partial [Armatimonadota bacterium]
VIVDLRGTVIASASQEYSIDFPEVSWAEQRAQDWWDAAKATCRECLVQSGVRADDIVGVSVDGTSCTVVVCKADGTPLRPVILWMDQRAHAQAERVTATGHKMLKYVGGSESAEWMLPKARWLKENEPAVYEKADYVVEGTDWLMFRLTGKWAASLNNVTCKWNYARPEGGWAPDLLSEVGLDDIMDKWPDAVLAMGERAGELSRSAADDLGLKEGTPVAQGGIDAYAAMMGLGVVHPGRMALVMGSSTCHMALAAEGVFGTHVWGPYPDALLPGTWVLEGGQTATGSIVKWFRDNFCSAEVHEAQRQGRNPYEVLDEKASAVEPGAEGLVVIDYWQGNRTPLRDPLARGMLWGLSLRHGVGHIMRAIYEGTAFGTRHILEDLAQGGYRPEVIYACGGGARSRLWLQIHADACGVPICLTENPDATVLGTAICAAVGAGQFGSVPEASARMVRVREQVDPNPELKSVYDFYYDKYVRTSPRRRELMHEVAAGGER